ncbi:hypothetical protein [Streptomyces indicus]|uniref:Cobyrinic acid a,c-diamide synthase n=1 Tax=Streptomyces indicus TaxID=417292 RepID=A0A1G8XYM1_9ACTN|nr:hypothetical protein [Streptomyces indicus]SDJ95648.1 hypothetical protein SAMN05421806_103483 [Streptomyces indicus]
MSRRVSLPGADELFRTTGGMALQASSPRKQANGEARVPAPAGESDAAAAASGAAADEAEHTAADAESGEASRARTEEEQPAAQAPRAKRPAGAESSGAAKPAASAARKRGRAARRPSGRERHDEKITVYVSAEELMDLEHARLVLRGEHGLAVDRGRIVREAVAVVLADLESRGDASILVRRLRGR